MPNLEQIKLVEASLFIAGRPIKTDDLLTLIDGKGKEELNKIIDQISKNLEERNSFIEIVKIEDEYLMRVKPAIRKELGDIETRKSLPDEFIKLLAIIAMKQPIKLGDIRRIYSGKNIKENVLELARKGFIQVKKEKRTKFLTTTPHFANVFNLDPANMRSEIFKILTKRISQRVVEPPEMVRMEDKEEKEVLTEFEIKEIEEKYYDLMEKLEIEREEERKRLEEEEKKKAEEAALIKNLVLDPMASLFKPRKEEKQIKKEVEEENSKVKKD
ncbi:MAG: SMC-Scp complex subunit ScpB [Candidatus Helarchaeota archaeon]|nr:SMC-Scp complex subunit ScpB [Candidatus Helarchaeota archaeon]